MYLTPPGTIVLSEWEYGSRRILLALVELEGGPTGEGGWFVLGQGGIEFMENGIGIYVEEYWTEFGTTPTQT